jgi:hypothetical protein
VAEALASFVPWAFGALPVGDPLRANLPRLLALARERLASPRLVLQVGTWWPDDERTVRTLLGAVLLTNPLLVAIDHQFYMIVLNKCLKSSQNR